MPSMDELYTALRNADAAGDTAAAQRLAAHIKTVQAAAPTPTAEQSSFGQHLGNMAAGALRGAGSIGATLMAPIDMIGDAMDGKGLSLDANRQRRKEMDTALQYMGAQPDSLLYKAGKLGGEVAGTAGAGGLLANGARAAGMSPALVAALSSGGLRAGGATGAAGMGIRTLGGAATGAASAGLVDPETAGSGAVFGGLLPGGLALSGKVGGALADGVNSAAKSLMQSAIKPTIAQLKSGDAATAVDTLLKYGINPTQGGVSKLRDLIDNLNGEISNRIGSSTATISKQDVLKALDPVRTRFGAQVSPTADLSAIQSTADDFLAHPNLIGNDIPVQTAQELKQGTYRVLAKKYGQMGTADTEAQKALARGLKDEIAQAVPGVGALNAEESNLISTLNVAERRALMELNKNPMGLASLAHNPASFAMFMADKSALFKSLAARMMNSTAAGAQVAVPRLEGALANPLLRNAVSLPATRGYGE